MSVLGRIMALFPGALAALLVLAMWSFVAAPTLVNLLLVAFVIYGLPPLAYRIHDRRFPLREGGSRLIGEDYSPWYGGHQIQLIYLTFPVLERMLRLVPGLFSLWLRLWGARVGRGVYWTPHFELSDRALLEIGDRVVFGHKTQIYAHLIKPTRKKNLLLYAKRIRIGDGAFIGGGVVMGPGVVVAPGAFVEVGKHLYPNTEHE